MQNAIQIVNVDSIKGCAILLFQADSKNNYFCIIKKRLLGFSKKPCWGFYIGLHETEYAKVLSSNEAKLDSFSFLGIAGGDVFIPSRLAETLLTERPQHFVGVHKWQEDMQSIETPSLVSACVELANKVIGILGSSL